MKRSTRLDALFSTRPGAETFDAPPPVEPTQAVREAPLGAPNAASATRLKSSAISAMGSALGHLTARAQAADRIEEGAVVVELDPALLDGSIVADRVSDATDPTLAGLVDSMRWNGQQVPILVRPHPDASGRYQIAFGHRRARAASELGRPVRALVRNLTDEELVIAQGKENLDRRNLSYIERAFFALRLEAMTFDRDTICAAMSTDKADVSRYVALAKTIPEYVVAAVGPAPKAGRARWQTLSERVGLVDSHKIEKFIDDPSYRSLATDQRFVNLFRWLTSDHPLSSIKRTIWVDRHGRRLARVEETSRHFQISIDRRIEAGFGEYLMQNLHELLDRYQKKCEDPSS